LPGYSAKLVHVESQIGSGALPTNTIPSIGIGITPNNGSDSELKKLELMLRSLPLPVLGRIHDGTLILDLRTLDQSHLLTDQLASLTL
jgi:L-seryl-tRNA(Ser) seleniumtransferase